MLLASFASAAALSQRVRARGSFLAVAEARAAPAAVAASAAAAGGPGTNMCGRARGFQCADGTLVQPSNYYIPCDLVTGCTSKLCCHNQPPKATVMGTVPPAPISKKEVETLKKAYQQEAAKLRVMQKTYERNKKEIAWKSKHNQWPSKPTWAPTLPPTPVPGPIHAAVAMAEKQKTATTTTTTPIPTISEPLGLAPTLSPETLQQIVAITNTETYDQKLIRQQYNDGFAQGFKAGFKVKPVTVVPVTVLVTQAPSSPPPAMAPAAAPIKVTITAPKPTGPTVGQVQNR